MNTRRTLTLTMKEDLPDGRTLSVQVTIPVFKIKLARVPIVYDEILDMDLALDAQISHFAAT